MSGRRTRALITTSAMAGIARRWQRARCSRALFLSAVVLVFGSASAEAGGDRFQVKVHDFVRKGRLSATFTVISASGKELLLGSCKELHVQARYAWWKWWWDDHRTISADIQAHALDVVERTSNDETLEFGYIGDGWHVPDSSQPCRIVSHALVEFPDRVLPNAKAAVYSFYDWP